MAVLSVDLACRRWSDLGIVILKRTEDSFALLESERRAEVECEIVPFTAPGLHGDPALDRGSVDAEILAGRLNHLCGVRGIRVMLLDGPQAWKSKENGLEHARVSERQLNTMSKTGLPGLVKPLSCRRFAEFCMDVYDAMARRGWRRLATHDQEGSPQERVLVESYPNAAWKSLGLKPLPGKRKARVSDLAEAYAALNRLIGIRTNRPPNHDQLQAIVGGLPGLALEARGSGEMRIVGAPPRREDGQWREGFIMLPLPPRRHSSWVESLRRLR